MESRSATDVPRQRRRRRKRTSISYATSSSHSITNENTVPAYPGLLSTTTIGSDKNLGPAAFPSLPFKRQRSDSEDYLKNSAPSKRGLFSAGLRSFVSTEHQNDRSRHELHSFRKITEATEAEDVETSCEGLLDQDVMDTMQTSPILAPVDLDIHEEPQISWNRIELGLQLYIFDNLLQQFKQPRIVADILGLNSNDLRTLAHVKNQRVLQPETTEELWEHCRLLGDETKAFIDPRILKGHLDYFAYVSQFEDVSAVQRRTAVAFLRQRQIEGAFVEALLQQETGVWSRPGYRDEDQLHDVKDSHMIAYDDEAEWPSLLARVPVDSSHDLDMVVSRFRSSYLPSTIRSELLAQPVQDLSSFEMWLIYALVPSDTNNLALGGQQLGYNRPGLQAINDPALYGLWMSLSHQAQEADAPIDASPDSLMKTHSMLYTVARTIHQSRTLRQKIEHMPLTRQQKTRVLKVAEKHQSSMLVDYSKNSLHDTLGHQAVDPSTPKSISSESSTPLTQRSRSLQSTASESCPSNLITSSSPDLGQGYSSAISPEPTCIGHPQDKETIPSQRADRHRRDTLSTNATLVLTNQKPTYRAPDTSNNLHTVQSPRHDADQRIRASSQESYHTAPDYEGNDVKVSIVPQQITRRTPSPPPWSPITEEDGETHEVGSSSFLKSIPGTAITGLGLNTIDGRSIFGKVTTNNGHSPGSRRSPAIVKRGQADQASNVPISQTQSALSSSIHEPVTSPASLPTTTSSSKATSTNDERQRSPSKRPSPSSPPTSQHDHSSSSEPPKKKRKIVATPQAKDHPKTVNPKLDLRMPVPASNSSSESTAPSRKMSSPSPKKVRCDKGKKRGPYNTKKNRSGMQSKVEVGHKGTTTSVRTDGEGTGSKKKRSSINDRPDTSSIEVDKAAGGREERGVLIMTNDGHIVVQNGTDSEYQGDSRTSWLGTENLLETVH